MMVQENTLERCIYMLRVCGVCIPGSGPWLCALPPAVGKAGTVLTTGREKKKRETS